MPQQTFILKLSARELEYLVKSLEKAKAFISGPLGAATTSQDDRMTFASIDEKVRKLSNLLNDDAN